jgi:hypothetical protein
MECYINVLFKVVVSMFCIIFSILNLEIIFLDEVFRLTKSQIFQYYQAVFLRLHPSELIELPKMALTNVLNTIL